MSAPGTGYIDGISGGVLYGWARPPEPDPRLVEILLDNAPIGTAPANLHRADLLQNNIGDGCHGFAFRLPRELAYRRGAILEVQTPGGRTRLGHGGAPLETYVHDDSLRFDDDLPHWELIARHDAMWGVLSAERYRQGEMTPEIRAEFFETGAAYIAARLARIEALLGPIHRGAAVDFGCGVGRLVIPLARAFDQVVGIDIADTMLANARANVAEAGLHAAFCHTPDQLAALLPNGADYVNSFIVFQHIPEPVGMQALDSLLRHLKPGGAGCLHIVTANLHEPGRCAWVNPVQLEGDVVGMQMNSYSLSNVTALMYRHAIRTFTADFEQHGAHIGCILSFRKEAAA